MVIGFKRYILYDYDKIEDTNLNRLVGATELDVELESPKMAIAIRLIRGLHYDVLYYEYDGNKGTIKPHLKTEMPLKPCLHYEIHNVGDINF